MSLPQRVIVTGAAQGIGRAVALRLASSGVYLALWDVKREGVEDTAKLCCEKGAQSRGLAMDVGDAPAPGNLLKGVVRALDEQRVRVFLGAGALASAGDAVEVGQPVR